MRPCVRELVWVLAAAAIVGHPGAVFGADEPSGSRSAQCIVRIMSDPDMLPVGAEMINSLLGSTPVLGEPAREILGSKAESIDDVVTVSFELLEHSQSRMGLVLTGTIAVGVHADDARPAAEELLAAICVRLEGALRVVGEIDQRRFHERLEAVDAELSRLREQYELIRAKRQELLKQAGRDDLSRARIENTINELEDFRQKIALSLAGAQAREAALTEQIAKVGQQAIEAAEKSAVVKELNEIVDIRKVELAYEQERYEKGLASQSDLNGLQEALARARADLARYRESVSETAGAGLLAELNKELVTLSVETAQQEAQLVAIQQRLTEIRERGLLELADRYEREVELQMALSERAVRDLTEEQFELKETIRNLRMPEVVVIGG
jgi:chromosome segregation ATPase